MSILKRNRSEDKEIETLAMANCLMLLSRVDSAIRPLGGRVFTCKTCNRKFNSFQALGGHRASHRKPRLTTGDLNPIIRKSNSHECSICGKGFTIGQALGGHMRRHRAEKSEGLVERETTEVMPVLKKSSSGGKRVLSLDLSLSLFEKDIKLEKSVVPSWLSLRLNNEVLDLHL